MSTLTHDIDLASARESNDPAEWRAVFERLTALYGGSLRRTCRGYERDPQRQDELLQEIEVQQLEVGAALQDADFVVDGHGVRMRSVQEHAPLWSQITRTIERAEEKSKDGVVRPSARKADGEKPGDKR